MKKIEGWSIEKTMAFAKQHYEAKKTFTGGLLFDHCVVVSKQAETIAARLYQDVRADFMPDNTKESIAAIVQAALLHDVLNVSACAFEQIAETTTVQIAAMVADISRDFRLVETKRDMEFRGRLSQSPVGSQIIVAADVICTARDLLSSLAAHGIEVVPRAKKILTQLDGDLLALHAANRYYMLRLYVHAARNMLADVSQKIKDCKHQAKIDKMLAQTTKRLRESAEAEKKSKTKATKKKEVRYARKRTAESDSE
jgi:(p)ppGpp synthase/HD superfamily hydrolase